MSILSPAVWESETSKQLDTVIRTPQNPMLPSIQIIPRTWKRWFMETFLCMKVEVLN
jgi:hypothetical protein